MITASSIIRYPNHSELSNKKVKAIPEQLKDEQEAPECRLGLSNLSYYKALTNYLIFFSLKHQYLEARAFALFSPDKIHSSLKSNLFVLLGTSCSGKTSLSKAICKANPKVIVIEHDGRLRQLVLEFLKNKAQESYEQLYSIFGLSMLHYISCPEDDLFWKRSFNLLSLHMPHIVKLRELCQKHFKSLHETAYYCILEECKFLACLDFTIIVHVVGNRGLSHFTPLTSKIMLVYCSFSRLGSRIKKRNERAFNDNQPLEMRYISIVFEQFSKLFRAQHRSNEMALEKVYAKKIAATIEQSHQKIPFFSPQTIDVKKYTRDIFQNLGNHDKDTFIITPSSNFPIIISKTSSSFYITNKANSKLIK